MNAGHVICILSVNNYTMFSLFVFLFPVLASGVPAGGPRPHAGRVLRPDPPSVPQSALEEAPLPHSLLSGRVRPLTHNALGLDQWRLLL